MVIRCGARSEKGQHLQHSGPGRVLSVAAVALLVGACTIGSGTFGFGGPDYGDPVDGLPCASPGNEPVQARVSLHLVANGRRLPATMGVGTTGSSCNYPVRTEGEEGIIVVRGHQPVTATLDTFLTIWEYAIPVGSGGAGEFREAATHGQIRVNGGAVQGGPRAVTFRDGDTIELIPADELPDASR